MMHVLSWILEGCFHISLLKRGKNLYKGLGLEDVLVQHVSTLLIKSVMIVLYKKKKKRKVSLLWWSDEGLFAAVCHQEKIKRQTEAAILNFF